MEISLSLTSGDDSLIELPESTTTQTLFSLFIGIKEHYIAFQKLNIDVSDLIDKQSGFKTNCPFPNPTVGYGSVLKYH
ncbi:MAG: hypothetical protein ACD_57C00233G0001 [uncultured bacterium]|nr:MAG: hypothetical protein ACD_57C00233G0001 [uncultured bacterium]